MKKLFLLGVCILFVAVDSPASAGGFAEIESCYLCFDQNIIKKAKKDGVTDIIMIEAAGCATKRTIQKLVKMGGKLDARADVSFVAEDGSLILAKGMNPFIRAAAQQLRRDVIDFFVAQVKKGLIDPDYTAQIRTDPFTSFEKINALGAAGMNLCSTRHLFTNYQDCMVIQPQIVRKIAAVTTKPENAFLWSVRGSNLGAIKILYPKEGVAPGATLSDFTALQILASLPIVMVFNNLRQSSLPVPDNFDGKAAVKWLLKKGMQSDARTLAIAMATETVLSLLLQRHVPKCLKYPSDIFGDGVSKTEAMKIVQELCQKGLPNVFPALPSSQPNPEPKRIQL